MAGLSRLLGFGAVAIVCLLAVILLAPQQIPLVIYKLSIVSLGGYVGYWLDRHLFPYARPHTITAPSLLGAAFIRRAIIVGASLIAFAMAL